jgi:hypothetical protein
MTGRPTPFALAFGSIAAERFPAIAAALAASGTSSADRDAFVLVQPVGALLREMVPEDAEPEALDAYVRLLHHAYRHWRAGGPVYRVSDAVLDRATRGGPLSTYPAHRALYLQLPEHRVWRAPVATEPPEPLDGVFVTETESPGAIAVLGITGMHRNRPGFCAVAVEGHADPLDPEGAELLVQVERDDGTAAFAPLLAGGGAAGLYSLANAGELLLLTGRLLALIPPPAGEVPATGPDSAAFTERFVDLRAEEPAR